MLQPRGSTGPLRGWRGHRPAAHVHSSRTRGCRPPPCGTAATSTASLPATPMPSACLAFTDPTPLRRSAHFLTAEFDKTYGKTWHTVVGRNFGAHTTYETKHFAYFYIGQMGFLIFKVRRGPLSTSAAPRVSTLFSHDRFLLRALLIHDTDRRMRLAHGWPIPILFCMYTFRLNQMKLL